MKENTQIKIIVFSLTILVIGGTLTLDYYSSSKCPFWNRQLKGSYEFNEEPNFTCNELKDILSLNLGNWKYHNPPKNQSYQQCNDGRRVNNYIHERYSLKEIYKNKCLGSLKP